jgi:hypothetical protein
MNAFSSVTDEWSLFYLDRFGDVFALAIKARA